MRLSPVILVVNLLWILPALAAPSQLYNKTGTLEWTVSSVQRDAAGNEIHPVTSIRYVIYVSATQRAPFKMEMHLLTDQFDGRRDHQRPEGQIGPAGAGTSRRRTALVISWDSLHEALR